MKKLFLSLNGWNFHAGLFKLYGFSQKALILKHINPKKNIFFMQIPSVGPRAG